MGNGVKQIRPRADRGQISATAVTYGHSLLGAPLLYFPAVQPDRDTGLIIAGTHGDETTAVIALSCALRSLQPMQQRHHVILAVNPDGCQLGLRANSAGVDLNRNFPAANWLPGHSVYRWNSASSERDVRLSTGDAAGSEPETQALCQLIHRLKPAWVVSLHEPLACVEDPHQTLLGQQLSADFELPLVSNVGYETPGSFGSWCDDLSLPCITLELPAISADLASEKYLPALLALIDYDL